MIFLSGFSFPPETAGPAGSDEGEVVRSAGSRPARGVRLPEQPERSGAARRGAAASAPQQPPSARPLARPPPRGRVTAPPPAPPLPGPGRAQPRAAGQSPARVSAGGANPAAASVPRVPGVPEPRGDAGGNVCNGPSREDCPIPWPEVMV